MDPVAALTRLGGIGSTAQVLQLTSRKRLRLAVASGAITHVSRGRYALPVADAARAVAADVGGHLRGLSAAAHWGWETKWPPRWPELAVARAPRHPVDASVKVLDLRASEVDGWATSKLRTVLDCAHELPFDEALAVADSALRHGDVTDEEVDRLLRHDLEPRVRRVIEHATPLAANPFGSVLRAILIEARIDVVAQWATTIDGVTLHPDLADPFRALAIEANSFAHHGNKEDHEADCVRYNRLVVGGWTVLRFTWEQVMFCPQEVVATVRAAMLLPIAA